MKHSSSCLIYYMEHCFDITSIWWLCVVRCVFWLAGGKYERVSRKSISIKKWINSIFLHLRNYFWEIFITAIEDFFFRVYIASSKHSGSWKNSRQLCKPLSASRVCITVSNSPSSPRVWRMKLCKHGKSLLFFESNTKKTLFVSCQFMHALGSIWDASQVGDFGLLLLVRADWPNRW